MRTIIALLFLLHSLAADVNIGEIGVDQPIHSVQGEATKEKDLSKHHAQTQSQDVQHGSTQSCNPDVCQLLVKLGNMEARLAVSEKQVKWLTTSLQEAKTQLEHELSLGNQLKSTMEIQTAKLTALEYMVEELKTQRKDRARVAFSASLFESGEKVTGPFNTDTTLVFRKVFVNSGEAYNPITGIFTAPVGGIYYFRFTVFSLSDKARRVYLYKNKEQMVTVTDNKSSDDKEDGGSNAVVLHLAKGDVVFLQLVSGAHIYDDAFHHSTFSGFFLFGEN